MFNWKPYAQLVATIIAQQTNQPGIVSAEQSVEAALAPNLSLDQRVDASAQVAVEIIETVEGFKGAELVDDASIGELRQGVVEAVRAFAHGLAAKKAAAAVPATPPVA
jgi:phage tail protein X